MLSAISQICRMLSSATLAMTHFSQGFHDSSDILAVWPPWTNSSSGGPSSASSSDCSSPILKGHNTENQKKERDDGQKKWSPIRPEPLLQLVLESVVALFAWLISHTFSANEQYFSLTTNQAAMAYQPSIKKYQGFDFKNMKI